MIETCFLVPQDVQISLEQPLEYVDGRNPQIGEHIHALYKKR